MVEFIIFVFGTVIGSFLNVCIYRLPRKISVVKPDSFCPQCGIAIPFYYNIPVLSYFLLKGKCHHCKEPISFRYPVVEFFAGLLSWLSYIKFGPTPEFLFYTVFSYFLIIIAFIDLSTRMIYNRFLVILLAAGIFMNSFLHIIPWQDAALGFLSGGGLMVAFALIGYALFRKESLGMGDIKFAAVAGFFLGWKMILFALFFGFLIAFLILIFLMALRKVQLGDYLPLGPFMVAAIIVFIFWGSHLIQWYWHFILT